MVKKIHVREGDRINLGSLLFEQLDDEERYKLAETEANLSAHEQHLKQILWSFNLAQKELERAKKLYEKGTISQEKLEERETDYKKLKESLEQEKDTIKSVNATKDLLLFQIDRRKIVSSYDGIVNEIIVSEGEIAAPQSPSVCIIPDASYEVVFYVSVEDRVKLQNGHVVKASYEGCKNGRKAVIYFISTQSEFKPPNLFLDTEEENLSYKIKARFMRNDDSKCPNTLGLPARVYLND